MPTHFEFPSSTFLPLAVGFFGLGTGYLIYFSQELFGWPSRDDKVNYATGIWGIWMPGFMQFITGVYLFVGLTWFDVFKGNPALYAAALAFTAYGVHWFAIGMNRLRNADPRPNGFMAIAFTLISALGIVVFFTAGDWPVGLLFVGLTAIYVSDIFASLKGLFTETVNRLAEKSLGLCHLVTGLWLMYLTWASTLDFASHMHLPV